MPTLSGRLDYSQLYRIDPLSVSSFGGGPGNTAYNTLTLTGIEQVSATYSDPGAQVEDVNGNGLYNGVDSVLTTFPGDSTPTQLNRINTSDYGAAGFDFGSGTDYALLVDADGNTYLLISDNFDSSRLTGGTVVLQDAEGEGNMPVAFILCFGRGTAISTPAGPRAIETLCPGDLVRTVDGRDVAIAWIGCTRLGAGSIAANPRLRPITIGQGTLGGGLPQRPLTVSRQHRILLGPAEKPATGAEGEYFVPAIRLTVLSGIDLDETDGPVTYYHLLTDRHEAVEAEGLAAETLFLGPFSWAALDEKSRRELTALGYTPETQGPLMRPELKGRDAKSFVADLFDLKVKVA